MQTPSTKSIAKLTSAVQRLENRADQQEASMRKLQEDVAPLHSAMTQINAGVTLIKWLVSGLGVAAGALEFWRALHHG